MAVFLYVVYHGGAGLGNGRTDSVLLQFSQVGPGGNVGTKGNVIKVLNSCLLQEAKQLLVLGKVRLYGRSSNHRDGKAPLKVFKKNLDIITKIPGKMIANIKTAPTHYAFFIIYTNFITAIGGNEGNIGINHRAMINAFITSYAVVLYRKKNGFHILCTPLALFMVKLIIF